jgi:hypothetical protein
VKDSTDVVIGATVERELYDAIKDIAEREDRSISSVIRIAIRDYIRVQVTRNSNS